MCGLGRGRNSQGQKGEPRTLNVRAGRGLMGSVGSGAMVDTVESATDMGKCIQVREAPGDAEGKETSNQ